MELTLKRLLAGQGLTLFFNMGKALAKSHHTRLKLVFVD